MKIVSPKLDFYADGLFADHCLYADAYWPRKWFAGRTKREKLFSPCVPLDYWLIWRDRPMTDSVPIEFYSDWSEIRWRKGGRRIGMYLSPCLQADLRSAFGSKEQITLHLSLEYRAH